MKRAVFYCRATQGARIWLDETVVRINESGDGYTLRPIQSPGRFLHERVFRTPRPNSPWNCLSNLPRIIGWIPSLSETKSLRLYSTCWFYTSRSHATSERRLKRVFREVNRRPASSVCSQDRRIVVPLTCLELKSSGRAKTR